MVVYPTRMKMKALRSIFIGLGAIIAFSSSARGDLCAVDFAKFANPLRARIIADMKSAAESAKMSTIKVKEQEGRVILDIGYIQNDDREIVRLLPAGVHAEAWDEVACGSIVGPKFTTYLARMVSSVKSGSKVKFTGKLSPKELIEAQVEERAEGFTNPFTASGGREPLFWGPSDVANFRNSFEQLRVDQACRTLYGTSRIDQCGTLVFEITPGTGEFNFRKP